MITLRSFKKISYLEATYLELSCYLVFSLTGNYGKFYVFVGISSV